MRLSEAIRLGSLMKPQAFDSHGYDGSCALRAAGDAVGIKDIRGHLLNYSELRKRFPLLDGEMECPVAKQGCNVYDLMAAIYHLNDMHKWTREAIADWVELHEPLPDVAVPEAPGTHEPTHQGEQKPTPPVSENVP